MSSVFDYPSISVVIPSYNQGQYLEEALLSVIGQQYPNLEILVIDGGSTDNTLDVIQTYARHISYWQSQPDKGQADAINQGMNLSSGEIVCWLNSDDMYLPGTLLDIGKRFYGKTDQNYLLYGAAIILDGNENRLSGIPRLVEPFEAFRLTYFDFIMQPSAFWTRKLWQQTGDLNPGYNYVLDWDWFIRASEFVEFDYIPRFYSIYRVHSLHKTGCGGADRRQEIIHIVQKYSSDYWANLYLEMGQSYGAIQQTIKWLRELRVPNENFVLPLLFPHIAIKVRKRRDFYIPLRMYS